jgi:hypothetical protein
MAQFPDLPRPNATLSELIKAGRKGAPVPASQARIMTDVEKVDPLKAYELSRPPPNKVFIALDQSWAPWSYENPLPYEATSIQELSELADALVRDACFVPEERPLGIC